MTCFRMLFLVIILSASARMTESADAASPQRMLIVGDSMMRVTAHATELQLSRREGVESRSFTRLGSGLARLDVFDWMEQLDALVAEFDPEVTLVWFGANDRQNMRTDAGIIRPSAPEWELEYARRVGTAMDKLTAVEGARVVWLELPDMREGRLQQDVELINRIVRQEADRRDRVAFYPARALLSRRPGAFTMHIAGPTGMPLRVRDNDGVHLSRAGADYLAESLMRYLFEGDVIP